MNADSAFTIGKTHEICQDFGIAGKLKDKDSYYSIISDGCSSSPYTDIGARLLTLIIKEELKRIEEREASLVNLNYESCAEKARVLNSLLNLPEESLDATIMVSLSTIYETRIDVQGDGVVAIGLKDKRTLVISTDFDAGYPFYINYFPQYNNRYVNWEKIYEESKGHLVKITQIDANGQVLIISENCILSEIFERNICINKTPKGCEIFVQMNKEQIKDYIEHITLISDGIKTFYKVEDTNSSKTSSIIDYHLIIFQLLGFINFNGKFVQRRLNKFLKQCSSQKIQHSDDVSFGTIFLGN